MANLDHLIGSLVLTVISEHPAGLNIPLGAALLVTPFIYDADVTATTASLVCGAALRALSFRRGPIRQPYGSWQRLIV